MTSFWTAKNATAQQAAAGGGGLTVQFDGKVLYPAEQAARRAVGRADGRPREAWRAASGVHARQEREAVPYRELRAFVARTCHAVDRRARSGGRP